MNRFIYELRRLEEIRQLMGGTNIPPNKSVFYMNFEELNKFRIKAKAWEKNNYEKK